ncbi:MAG: NAD(P)/FAD-dependent oxidoreductase [Dissulfurispiraceae bacterium]|jgi:predicted Rossmann fold flavoprotein|nr:NAD(P)/FAD-dependent oxidoreductase [Dissulfurispiraceae bacterium]
MKFDLIVIGGGASGMMCALTAGRRGRSVLVLDHADRVCKKVLASGGGRCNCTNINTNHTNYISSNPDFCRSALAGYRPSDFLRLMEGHNIRWQEEDDGRVFCTDGSSKIVNMLLEECRAAGVKISVNSQIIKIKKRENFIVVTKRGTIECSSLVIGAGGLSYKDLGASAYGFNLAEDLGHKNTRLKPGLVPLIWSKDDLAAYSMLSGITLKCSVKYAKKIFRGSMLFTQKGISGPVILQASLYWQDGEQLGIELLPDIDALELLMQNRQRKIMLKNLLSAYLASGFCEAWTEANNFNRQLNACSERELRRIADALKNWTIRPHGTEGFRKAEVTLGGVDTADISSKTMESNIVQGLYFSGEVMDVTGQLGGYNLHWAWASGHAAGENA